MKNCPHCNSDKLVERLNMSTGERTYNCKTCKNSFKSTGEKIEIVYDFPDKIALMRQLKTHWII
ncbi:MAG: hypothetical protein ABRQ25_05125 [Clostridiaceae bacterium]